ncbi:hypothetical protein Tsubulata_029052, partial [Turnera subulata]
KCPPPPTCPPISPPPRPRPFPRIRPRPPLYPPSRHLLPRQPNNNPGPLSNRATILSITQELKRNITFDPLNYTGTWVGNNYCLFKGYFCDTVPDRNITGLATIDFTGARFRGNLNLSRFILNLPDIALFHANSNNFSGAISPNINQLRYLYELDLSNNKFMGGFPVNVFGATKLTYVDIRFNGYLGRVPAQAFNIDTDVLFINNNGFSQRIPANFGNTPALFLTLANNKLTGPIPRSIGRAWNTLTEALFLGNRLTGCLPFEIGYLTKATVLDFGSNLLTGPIPQSFGCLAKLAFLNMAHNRFYGQVPEVLCRLPNAYNFTLAYNYFTQVGPQCRRLIRARRLNVNNNCIMGLPNQRNALECSRFFATTRSCARETSFSFVPCTLPASSGCKGGNHKAPTKCSKATTAVPPPPTPPSPPSPPPPTLPLDTELLVFSDQRLAVVYPIIQKFKSIITSDPLNITKTWVGSDVCNYTGFFCDNPPYNKSAIAVASIDFNGFQLSAPTLDGFLDQLPDIALFHANSNNFAGTISPNISKLPYLYELDISNNLFSGPFPAAVLGMNGLTFLDLRFNFFAGSVPPQIFTQSLEVLFINDNNFMTGLPDNLVGTHILYLTLANNKITGPLPTGIFKAFSFLTEVLLLNNQLTGCLPYEVGLLREAIVFDIGNNQLTGPLPLSLACLEKVEQLNFAGNQLFGMVPEMVCQLPNLANFSLSDNYFTAVGPICRFLILRGVLDVRNNCIPDLPNQRSVVECADFFAHPKPCPNLWSHTFIPCKPSFTSVSKLPKISSSP